MKRRIFCDCSVPKVLDSHIIFAVLICFCVMIGIAIFANGGGTKPFKDLSESDVASASVQILPPGTTIQIHNKKEFVKLLNKLVIYHEDDSYHDYNGQAVIYTITLSNGEEHEVMAYNPFLVIDGTGYKTKYRPCEALGRYGNQLSGSGGGA